MAAVEVPQTLKYRGGQLNSVPILEVENFTNWKKRFMCHIIGIEPQFENIISTGPFIPMAAGQKKPEAQWTADERKAANLDQRLKSLIMSVLPDDQINSVINCLTAKSTWDDMILYHEGPSDVKERRVMDLELYYNTFKFKEGESLTQTFTRYKALMNELVNDGIKLLKLEINTGFISGLPKKWLSFCQSLRNTNHVKDSELASLFGKLKYEKKNLIDSIYETEKSNFLVSATPLSTAFLTISILQDFQDSPDDEEDTRSSHEYLNDLEEEYQARALLAKSKRFFKKVPSYQSPFQPKLLYSSEHKPEPRRTKDFEAKYNKVKAKLALLNSSASAPSSSSGNNKGLIAKTSGPKDPVFVKSSADNSRVSITGSNKPKLPETEDSTLLNHDAGKHSLPPLEKLTGAEPVSAPKTIKSILKSKSTFKAETLKGITINKSSSASARGNKSSSVSKTNSAPASKLKNVKIEDDPSLAIVPSIALQNKYKTQFKMNCELCGQNNHLSENCYEVLFCKKCKRTNHRTCDHAGFMSSMDKNQYHTGQSKSSSRSEPSRPTMPFPSCIHCKYNDHQSDDYVYYPIFEICGSYDHDTHGHNRIIFLRKGIKPRNHQHITKNCETCGSNVHTTSDHNDIEWFRKKEALQAKKSESFQASKTESSNALRSKTPTKNWVSKQN
ncbi:hypothetical protein Tco_0621486 [Tanacetum coccineum]